jgi:hypothetical protein
VILKNKLVLFSLRLKKGRVEMNRMTHFLKGLIFLIEKGISELIPINVDV